MLHTDDFSTVFNCFGNEDFLLLGGDFNCKHINWLNYNNNSNGLILNDFMSADRNFSTLKLIWSRNPTRFTSNSFSFIDLFLLSNNINCDDYARTYPFESDHLAIEIFIEIPSINTIDSITAYNFNRTNWPKVSDVLISRLQTKFPPINKNISSLEINSYIDFLEDTTLQVVIDHTPLIKMHPKYRLQLNQFTLKCIYEKKILRRKWFNTGRNNVLLKSFINRMSKIISELISI